MWEREVAKQPIVFSTTPSSQHLKNIYGKISTHWHKSNPGFFYSVCIYGEICCILWSLVYKESFLLWILFSPDCESMSKSREPHLVQWKWLKMPVALRQSAAIASVENATEGAKHNQRHNSGVTQKNSGQEYTDTWCSAIPIRPETKLHNHHRVAVIQQKQDTRFWSDFSPPLALILQAATAKWTCSSHVAPLQLLSLLHSSQHQIKNLINFTQVRVVGDSIKDLTFFQTHRVPGSGSKVGGSLWGRTRAALGGSGSRSAPQQRLRETRGGKTPPGAGRQRGEGARLTWGKEGSMHVIHPSLPFQVPPEVLTDRWWKLLSLCIFNSCFFEGKRHMPFLSYIFKYFSEHQMEQTGNSEGGILLSEIEGYF